MSKKLRLVSMVLIMVIMLLPLSTIALAEEDLTFGFSPETFIARLEEGSKQLKIPFGGSVVKNDRMYTITFDKDFRIIASSNNKGNIASATLVCMLLNSDSDEFLSRQSSYVRLFVFAIENMDFLDCEEIINSFIQDKEYKSDNARYNIVNEPGLVTCVVANIINTDTNTNEESSPGPTIKPLPKYDELAKGSKGNAVKELQQRLIDLKYLTGTADGAYGEKTALAVTTFQKVENITPTGIADPDTQATLFSEDAIENPEPPFDPSAYEKMNYKAIARNPDAYEYEDIWFTGKVIQVVESNEDIYNVTKPYAIYRIATKGSYSDVVLVTYYRADGTPRILDDDRVTVYGMCEGVTSYESTMGGTITIPSCIADIIELK